MEFSFNTLTAFRLVRRRRSRAPWAHVEGSAKRGNGPSRVGFNSQAGIDRGSCRALMPMTGTAMKCRANRMRKERVRQVRVRPQLPSPAQGALAPFSHELQTKDKIGGGTAFQTVLHGQDACAIQGSRTCCPDAIRWKTAPGSPDRDVTAPAWVDEKLVLTGRTLLPGFVDEMGGWGRSRLQPASPQGFGLGAVPSPQPPGATKRTLGDPSFSLCQFQAFISPAPACNPP